MLLGISKSLRVRPTENEHADVRYYITDLVDGCIKGTNDEQTAKDFSQSEDYYVDDRTNETYAGAVGYSPAQG